MKTLDRYTPLQIREAFHLEFLRRLAGKLKPRDYALKGGVNMRLFYASVRYSEDMDLDITRVSVGVLQDTVMAILNSANFIAGLKPFGVAQLTAPDMAKAKQTETTQRFKIHLISAAGEDFFTKIEFSRRGLDSGAVAAQIPAAILRPYRFAPIIVSHYDAAAAFRQKLQALANRKAVQARDIFDLNVLLSQVDPDVSASVALPTLKKALENLYSVSYGQFRDTVLTYLAEEDCKVYGNPSAWDEMKLRVAEVLEK